MNEILILINSRLGYLSFNDSDQLPSEITPSGTVGIHPRSTEGPVIHHQMKASFKIRGMRLICRLDRSIVVRRHSIFENSKLSFWKTIFIEGDDREFSTCGDITVEMKLIWKIKWDNYGKIIYNWKFEQVNHMKCGNRRGSRWTQSIESDSIRNSREIGSGEIQKEKRQVVKVQEKAEKFRRMGHIEMAWVRVLKEIFIHSVGR